MNAFSSEVQGMSKVPVVDAVVAYDCPLTSESYLLVMQNALHILRTKHGLIPTFNIWEAGLNISEVTKIHCDEPTVEDHSIYDFLTKVEIPLKLDGILSYLPTQALRLDEIQRCDKIEHVFLSPDAKTWYPYYETYALNE